MGEKFLQTSAISAFIQILINIDLSDVELETLEKSAFFQSTERIEVLEFSYNQISAFKSQCFSVPWGNQSEKFGLVAQCQR